MTAWWIGNIVYLAVIVPVVVLLLTLMLRPALQISRHADEVAESGESLAPHLDGLEELARTPELLREVTVGLERYGNALDELR